MGLDSFWKLPEGAVVNINPPLRLCGGMLSGSGKGSFRGKVYDRAVEAITGESLYQLEIPNATIKKMADALENGQYETFEANASYGTSPQEFADIQRMFRIYADAGATLHGWW